MHLSPSNKVHFAPLMHPTHTPILLHARDPRRGELVVACSDAALARGVRLNMPLAEAAALAQRGGACVIQPHDPAADLAALARLAEHCERFSPLVGWQTVEGSKAATNGRGGQGSGVGGRESGVGPDCLFLDVRGIGVLFGGEEALAREVVAETSRLGYEARVAIAETIGAAWAGTRVQGSGFGVQENAEAATDSRLPTPAPLPLAVLRIPPETLDLLSQLGVTQLDQLLALPRESLRSRFGERLLLRIDQFFGRAQETIAAHRPPPQFAAEWVLEYPAERREVVEQILEQLALRVARALADRREGAVQLHCRLDCAPGGPLFLEVGLFRPSAEPGHLWDLLRMQLEQAALCCWGRAALRGPVGRVTLEARLTAPLENRQGELFAGGEHEIERQLALFIDRCSSRLGADAVLRPELTADPLPERAMKWKQGVRSRGSGVGRQKWKAARGTEYSGRSTKSRRRSAASSDSRPPTPDSQRSPLHRPLALYDPPLSLHTLSVVPDGPPVKFDFGGERHTVSRHWGPERIETGWWRGRSVRRDYWRVETASGRRFWLFRSLQEGTWHLHGEF